MLTMKTLINSTKLVLLLHMFMNSTPSTNILTNSSHMNQSYQHNKTMLKVFLPKQVLKNNLKNLLMFNMKLQFRSWKNSHPTSQLNKLKNTTKKFPTAMKFQLKIKKLTSRFQIFNYLLNKFINKHLTNHITQKQQFLSTLTNTEPSLKLMNLHQLFKLTTPGMKRPKLIKFIVLKSPLLMKFWLKKNVKMIDEYQVKS